MQKSLLNLLPPTRIELMALRHIFLEGWISPCGDLYD